MMRGKYKVHYRSEGRTACDVGLLYAARSSENLEEVTCERCLARLKEKP